jgi:CPA1 family monovalent cation:H+ antiporter
MAIHEIIAILITFTAAASYINYRYVRLPQVIGVTLITLIISMLVIAMAHLGVPLGARIQTAMVSIDFSETVLNGMLSFLLFAGALHINVLELAQYRIAVFSLATYSVLLSTVIVGTLVYGVSILVEYPLPLISCLIFGSLISPTDPIAVISVFKNLKAPKNLEIKIVGESLFNDGISIVLFVILLSGAHHGVSNLEFFLREFTQQAGGAIFLGAMLGFLVAYLIKQVNNFEVACLLTLALVTGGFVFADSIVDVSGPIVMVVSGLIIGYSMRYGHISHTNLDRLDTFWTLIDELLNAVLFTLIGFELLEFIVDIPSIMLGVLVIPFVLLARFISVSVPLLFLPNSPHRLRLATIMTWGGLRGAVSIALALQIPENYGRTTLVTLTYLVVLFSLLVQGLTIRPLMTRMLHLKES